MYQQNNPPLSPRNILPTMYDLSTETLEDEGLPDEFHLIQPELLRLTFQPTDYTEDQIFVASDLILYYDPRHPLWYKRPDWLAVLGVSRFYEETELRLSYVTWQEGINPFVVIELISPGTEAEDLGKILWEVNQPPPKWIIYEQILRIPYYFVFNRYNNEFKGFGLMMNRYQPLSLEKQGFWLPEARIGLGLWQGNYQGFERLWLRWYDKQGNWLPTPTQKANKLAKQEKQRADKAELEIQRLKELLHQAGLEIPE